MNDVAGKGERRIEGLAVSRGVGAGRAVFYEESDPGFEFRLITPEQVPHELARFRQAIVVAADQLRGLIPANTTDAADNLAEILNVQLLILEQSSFIAKVEDRITNGPLNVEWAVRTVALEYSAKQAQADDDHMRDKRLDIEDICRRIQTVLDGPRSPDHRLYAGAVVLARELRPSEVIELHRSGPAAIVTERGGWTSHTSILAREFMIPMISGVKPLSSLAGETDHMIVDGNAGHAILNPARQTIERYARTVIEVETPFENPSPTASSQTLDGVTITVRANVDIPEAYQLAVRHGAKGIGLFRSESLITRPGRIPSETEQIAAYADLADAAGSDGVRIRTFDIGLDRYRLNQSYRETNPALGLRGIRLSLHERAEFRTQVRAILRASAGRNIDLLIPMVSGAEEVDRALAFIEEERQDLIRRSTPIGEPGIGAMIEVPAGVFCARAIAERVDFLAIGTNDLVQYLLAVDRDNDSVAEWYQTLHPAVLCALQQVFAAAKDAAIPAILCGEMASSPFYLPLLLGLGARELSMNPNAIGRIKGLVSAISISGSESIAAAALKAETAAEVESALREHYRTQWGGVFPVQFLTSQQT